MASVDSVRRMHPDEPVADESIADAQVRDELPTDLDVAATMGDYVFPDNSRRRIPGYMYLFLGLAALVVVAVADGSALVNGGFLVGGAALVLMGAYHLQAGWHVAFDEREALVAATRAVGFPIGHASAQMAWRGLRSRPTWRILLYSNESPPDRRGLVLVDAVDGSIVAQFDEENPEDWSAD
jgi:hypothetical protein